MTLAPLPGGTFRLAGVAVDSQGRIVVGTSTPAQPPGQELPLSPAALGAPEEAAHSDVRILRYLPGGHLDPSFGGGGIVETSLGLPAPSQEVVRSPPRRCSRRPGSRSTAETGS